MNIIRQLHQPSLRLAGLYLGIIMTISLFFSASLYQLSMQEFNLGLRNAKPIISSFEDPLAAGTEEGAVARLKARLQAEYEAQYNHAKQRVLTRLTLINLAILIGGGFLSYYLARRTLKPIEEAHEAQSRFTADASHELRTPLTAMQSEIEVALMDPKLTLGQAKERLRSNLEELAKLTALSEGLLRLSHLENKEIRKEPVELEQVTNQALSRVLPRAEAKNILISSKVPGGLQTLADEVSLTEALVILLDNAIKYSPNKTEITITSSSSPRHASLSVHDHGMGIKATELPHIFERFYRADSARSKQQVQGYGLGLAIAKDIVTLHGGTIGVQSRPGEGSVFTIQLPKHV